MTTKNSTGSKQEDSTGGHAKAATAAGLAAAAVVAGAIAVRAYRKHASSGAKEAIFHLRQEDEEWVLQLEGKDTFESTYETKEEGVQAARELARGSAPCELVIFRTDGTVQDRHHYQEK